MPDIPQLSGGASEHGPAGPDIHAPISDTDSLWSDDAPETEGSPPPGRKGGDAPEFRQAQPSGDYDYEDPVHAASEKAKDPPETKPATEAAEGVVKQPSQPQEIPPELLYRAARLGYSHDDLGDFSTVKSLERAISREEARIGGAQQQQQQQQQQQFQNPFAQFADPAKMQLAPQIDKQKLLDQGWDEGMVAALEQTVAANNAHIAKAVLAPLAQHAAQLYEYTAKKHVYDHQKEQQALERETKRQVEQWNDEFRNAVSEAPDEFSEILADPENVQRVHRACGTIVGAMLQMGQKVPGGRAGAQQLLEKAIAFEFGVSKVRTAVRDQVRQDLSRRDSRAVARARPAGHRRPQSGDDAAQDFLNRSFYGPSGLLDGRRF